ncbi:MAG: ATP-binding protein [Pseudomonadota bacterium]
MKDGQLARHNRLLFRSYLFVVVGLIATATVLDFGFSKLQAKLETGEDRWLASTLQLIERELRAHDESERSGAVEKLQREIGIGVQLLAEAQIASMPATNSELQRLVDDTGRVSYLKVLPSSDLTLLLGPVDVPRENPVLRFVPPLFYLCVFVIIGLWLRPVLRDLNLLTHASQRFAADYRVPLATAAKTTQLTSLAKNLDQMSQRISGLIRAQKELTTALSHEMRTPLARIRFALAVAGENGNAALRQQLAAMGDDVQEIDHLIASMLNYARLDHPEQRMDWFDTPVRNWLDQTLGRCGPTDKALEVIASDGELFVMDARLMGMAVSNLVVNASRYAAARVRVTAHAEAARFVISVEDDGEGIPAAQRESVFKAFTRLDTSRNRETGGFGLGLAIVSRIASLHGGEATVAASSDIGGAKFVIMWPRVAGHGHD